LSVLVAVAAAGLAAVGCTKHNPLYCESAGDCASFSCNTTARECNPVQECTDSTTCSAPGAPICDTGLGYCVPCSDPGPSSACEAHDSSLPICADDGHCVECLDHGACGVGAPICDSELHECRGCDSSTECAGLGGANDICSPTGQCVACVNHGDCSATSQVCDRSTNACAAAADVFYVSGTDGTDNGSCGSQLQPCKTVEFGLALMGGQPFLRVAGGDYSGNIEVTNQAVTIVAPGVTFTSLGSDRPALLVNNGSTLAIDGMTLRGAHGSNANGITCENNGTSLTLYDARITGNEVNGIYSFGCEIDVQRGSSDNNTAVGIEAFNGSLTVSAARLYHNLAGGIHLSTVEYDITNSFIVDNGRGAAGGSDVGGVRVDNSTENRPQRFAFNTVAGNTARTAATASGIHCDTSGMAAPVLTSNLIWGNAGGMAQTSGNCTWRFSNIEGYADAGNNGNIDEDPGYENVIDGDYHVRTGSPCVDAGETIEDILFDYDLDRRGQGNGYDIGADEVE